jgi:hypothetical protein
MRVIAQRALPALAGQRHDEGQGGVAEGDRRGAGDGAGHVGDAVMHHAVLDVGRVGVGGGLAGFEAAALVDGDVRPRTEPGRICLTIVFADQLRRARRPAPARRRRRGRRRPAGVASMAAAVENSVWIREPNCCFQRLQGAAASVSG